MKRSPLKRKTRLRPMSKQKTLDNVQYINAKKEWTEDCIRRDGYKQCRFKGKPFAKGPTSIDQDERCILPAMESPHHRAGRHGSLLWDKRYFQALCFSHHAWVHNHAREARKRGYLMERTGR